jgi:hypothetical protein
VSLFQKDPETGILSDSPTRLLGCPDEASGATWASLRRVGPLAHSQKQNPGPFSAPACNLSSYKLIIGKRRLEVKVT